jgi:hypothetical protein
LSHVEFIEWERQESVWFSDTNQVLSTTQLLCESRSSKEIADELMMKYAHVVADVNVSQLEWKAVDECLEIQEYTIPNDDEEDNEYDEEDNDEDEQDLQITTLDFSSLQLFSSSTTCLPKLVMLISKIINKRISSKPSSSLTSPIIPLTTRSVERLFSEWRRKTIQNVSVLSSTMQMILLLKLFSFCDLLLVLQHHPLTPTITSFLKTLTDRDLKRKDYDKKVYQNNIKFPLPLVT